MPSQPPIPPLISLAVSNLPKTSLILLTSTLGATTNWLVLRLMCAALESKSYGTGHDTRNTQRKPDGQRIILVSWLRDGTWWRESGRKLGIDFQKIHLLDGLSTGLGMKTGGIADVEEAIMEAIESSAALNDRGNVTLVLDGLDFLLAATECEVLEMLDMIGEFREHVRSTIIASAANVPLPQSRITPLEVSHTAFMMSLAHQATLIMSVRGLITGAAKDVSGVLRISNGAGECVDDGCAEERESLYYVGSDGGVKVFERGA